ncbi:MAG: hypothetical protein ACE5GU_01230 [Candidatus Scalinduaceae bacterium]
MTFSKTDLTPKEKKYLKRQIRNVHNYVYFTIANLAAAIGLLSYYILTNKMFSGSTFALIIVLLLAARAISSNTKTPNYSSNYRNLKKTHRLSYCKT